MARPIKETPILRGKDAVAFQKERTKRKNKKADPKVKARIMDNYLKLTAISEF